MLNRLMSGNHWTRYVAMPPLPSDSFFASLPLEEFLQNLISSQLAAFQMSKIIYEYKVLGYNTAAKLFWCYSWFITKLLYKINKSCVHHFGHCTFNRLPCMSRYELFHCLEGLWKIRFIRGNYGQARASYPLPSHGSQFILKPNQLHTSWKLLRLLFLSVSCSSIKHFIDLSISNPHPTLSFTPVLQFWKHSSAFWEVIRWNISSWNWEYIFSKFFPTSNPHHNLELACLLEILRNILVKNTFIPGSHTLHSSSTSAILLTIPS